ncbi:hypothetical protein GCM10027347_17740 [Larkinella harenae]
MKKKKIQIGSETFRMPQAWADCSSAQILDLLPLTLTDLDKLDPGQRAKIKYEAARRLLQAPEDLLDQLDAAQRWRLMRLAGWVFTERIRHKPFESFEVQGVSYHLFAENFADTSAIEIAMANMQYLAYARRESPNPQAVYQLVATLCRPLRKDLARAKKSVDWNGDSREAYNTILAEERAVVFEKKKLPLGVIMGVLQYFEFTNNRFLERYKHAYEPADDDEEPLYPDGRGLITTFMDVAKTGVFGEFDQVCRQNGHTVWMFLLDNNLKIRRANARMEREMD